MAGVDGLLTGTGVDDEGVGPGVDVFVDPPGVGEQPVDEPAVRVVDEEADVTQGAAQAHHLEGEDEVAGYGASATGAVGGGVPPVEGAGVQGGADGFHAAKLRRIGAVVVCVWGVVRFLQFFFGGDELMILRSLDRRGMVEMKKPRRGRGAVFSSHILICALFSR